MSYQQIRGHALRSGELGADRMEQIRQNCLRVTPVITCRALLSATPGHQGRGEDLCKE